MTGPAPPAPPAGPAAAPLGVLLALAAAPAAGLLPSGPLPATPGGHLLLAGSLVALALLVHAGDRDLRGGDFARLLVAWSPFVAFGLLERPGGPAAAPPLGLALAAACALAASLAGAGGRALAVATVLAFGGSAVAGAAGLDLLPAAWNPATARGAGALPEAVAPAPEGQPVEGLRAGAPAPAPAPAGLVRGPGPWLARADAGRLPSRGPVALLLDGRPGAVRTEPDGATLVPSTEAPFEAPLAFDAFDAVVVLPGAWPDGDPAARAKAEALAAFVRRGGLLVGPGPDRDWPEALGRRLGTAGAAEVSGPDGARSLGLGRVVRAGSEAAVREALASGLWVPEAGTVFDRAISPPPGPAALARWRDRPEGRRAQGGILAVYALLLAALDQGRRRDGRLALLLLAPAAAVVAALAWSSPRDPGARLDAVVLDLGGPGGRRVEALWVSAGPAGWRGRVAFEGSGAVGVLGGRLAADRTVHVPPDGTAWVLRERSAAGVPAAGDREEPRAGFLAGLLTGRPAPARLRFGRGGPPVAAVEGMEAPAPWTLLVRAPGPP